MTTPTDRNTEAAETGLFEGLPQPSQAQEQQAQAKAAGKRGQGAPRLLQANRSQIELRASDLESLLAQDHRARRVWGYVVHQDLSKLIEAIKARGSNAGRAAIDPHILFALWLYATLDAVGECVNAQARNRGLLRMPVRGLAKVRSVVGLFVLAHNLMRTAVLAPQLIGWGRGPFAMAAQAA